MHFKSIQGLCLVQPDNYLFSCQNGVPVILLSQCPCGRYHLIPGTICPPHAPRNKMNNDGGNDGGWYAICTHLRHMKQIEIGTSAHCQSTIFPLNVKYLEWDLQLLTMVQLKALCSAFIFSLLCGDELIERLSPHQHSQSLLALWFALLALKKNHIYRGLFWTLTPCPKWVQMHNDALDLVTFFILFDIN